MPAASTLVLDQGDLPSLAACAVQRSFDDLILWHLVEPDGAAARRRSALETHASSWGIDRIVYTDAGDPGVPGMSPPADLFRSWYLVQAMVVASQIGCRRIIWPESVGPDGDAVAETVDRANTVAALSQISGGQESITIELPLIDLNPLQILELADDTGAPLIGFWPCRSGGKRPCGACDGCQPWIAAFQEGHVPWPWDA